MADKKKGNQIRNNPISQATQQVLKATSVSAGRRESDTLRIWELYQDQAILWRALALLQIPATFSMIILTLWLYGNRTIVLNVPQNPRPGSYTIDQLTDPIIIDTATDFINLVQSYTPKTARRQMLEAEQRIVEPLLTKFHQQIVERDLKAIEQTQRSQLYLINPTKPVLSRGKDIATVTFEGDLLRIVAGTETRSKTVVWHIDLQTIPRNKLNEYGVVISDIRVGVSSVGIIED
jgi:hypothetical protein